MTPLQPTYERIGKPVFEQSPYIVAWTLCSVLLMDGTLSQGYRWTVWDKRADKPVYTHTDKAEAAKEARKLARRVVTRNPLNP